jgi:hypothetical protein
MLRGQQFVIEAETQKVAPPRTKKSSYGWDLIKYMRSPNWSSLVMTTWTEYPIIVTS